ncbi:GNAT family N-acetyltransferase [Roseibacterium sp. SDUM158016]|jgi:GNAT superfamily N-acetyltransferase|uniref:GNAT family N-acetyltransferase n=1 Tax=Roseicyclus sediminis TaxID=2980997 RepID=UPI0021CE8977|nr:GNAT family N-acetyltransferase [Roseibacterium sp. SDUM158016]MCU4651619.1 GNAT family N-acetyltransferase [Roseibacterium sp. SDUM158016]
MKVIPAGTEVAFQITYLEMPDDPGIDPPPLPSDVRLEKAEAPPVWFFLSLYEAVGRDYEWRDRFEQAERDPDALAAFVGDPAVELWVAYSGGWPRGFFMLDLRKPGTCDIAYFGLVPEAVGSGLGGALLKTAVAMGWTRPGVTRMTLNTCDLDHPRALPLYQSIGFRPVRSEFRKRILFRDRDPSRHPA